MALESDTSAVRPGEELNRAALSDYLSKNLPEGAKNIQVEQFPNGHSNLVYLVRTDHREYVLRRPPLGPVAPKAHDMAREYRVLDAVHPHFPEAPQVFLLCEDPSVIGGVFFLMERRHGMVIRAALSRSAGRWITRAERVANGALVPLDPVEEQRTDQSGGAVTPAS